MKNSPEEIGELFCALLRDADALSLEIVRAVEAWDTNRAHKAASTAADIANRLERIRPYL